MKILAFALCFVCLLGGCKHTKQETAKSLGLSLLPAQEGTLDLSAAGKLFPSGFSGYVYLMNSECSTCIGLFLDFAKRLESGGYRGDLLVIIATATRPIVNHYIKEYDFYKSMHVVLSEEKGWGLESIEDVNGMVYKVTDNRINAVYQYFPSD